MSTFEDTPLSNKTEAREVAAALRYVERGWWVVPIHSVTDVGTCRCAKGPSCPSAGKHPIARLVPHGWREASSYGPTIRRWWKLCPGANVGVVTGPSQLASLDVDPRNGGAESLRQLQALHGDMPPTLHLQTGGGGEHFVFADPDRAIRKHSPLPGIDVLGGAWLFVAPPSRHRSGGFYRWDDFTTPLAPVPVWMRKPAP